MFTGGSAGGGVPAPCRLGRDPAACPGLAVRAGSSGAGARGSTRAALVRLAIARWPLSRSSTRAGSGTRRLGNARPQRPALRLLPEPRATRRGGQHQRGQSTQANAPLFPPVVPGSWRRRFEKRGGNRRMSGGWVELLLDRSNTPRTICRLSGRSKNSSSRCRSRSDVSLGLGETSSRTRTQLRRQLLLRRERQKGRLTRCTCKWRRGLPPATPRRRPP